MQIYLERGNPKQYFVGTRAVDSNVDILVEK